MDARRKPFDDADLLTKFEQEILREPYAQSRSKADEVAYMI
jgi:hypothetical protein